MRRRCDGEPISCATTSARACGAPTRRAKLLTASGFHGRVRELPSRDALVDIVKNLCAALFPTHYGRHDLTDESIDFFVGATLNDAPPSLSKQICRGLQFAPDRDVESEALRAEAILATRVFAHELLEIRNVLDTD